MTTFALIEGSAYHCGEMSRKLRREHKRIILGLGVKPHRELRARFDDSIFRKAWLIDGRLAALGGVTGTVLSGNGFIWLAFTEEALSYPIAIVREARAQIEALMATKRELQTLILWEDKISFRFARFLGFETLDGDDKMLVMVYRRNAAETD